MYNVSCLYFDRQVFIINILLKIEPFPPIYSLWCLLLPYVKAGVSCAYNVMVIIVRNGLGNLSPILGMAVCISHSN